MKDFISVKNAIAYAKIHFKKSSCRIVASCLMSRRLETAIEVALGSAVQNIVCKTAQDAIK